MLLSEFKAVSKVGKIDLYKSTLSNRLVGSAVTPKGEITFITKVEFDASKPIYVYPTEKANPETGEIVVLHVLSNTAKKEAVLTL